MAITYKLYGANVKGDVPKSVQKTDGSIVTCVPCDPANTDYQEYLAWVAEGNTPEPAE